MGGAVSLQSESGESEGLTGSGTKDNPYKISSAAELRKFAELVNDDGETTANAVLTDDIDLNPDMKIDEDGKVTNGDELDQWTSIGTSSSRYSGNFNGNGKTIKNLYINNTTSANDQGLFGYVGSSGTVQNLSVSGSVKGDAYVGGVVGYNNGGTVTGCIFSGSGSVSVTGSYYVGGVVGYSSGGSSGSDSDSASVTNCYNTGSVTSSGSPVGGVVGYNSGSSGGSGTVTGCYFLKTNELNNGLNGIGGDSSNTNATPVDDLTALCEKFKDDTDTWRISKSLNRPVLQDNAQDGLPPGLGTEASPYEISTATQLKNFATAVNNGIEKSAHAKLMNNIDLSSVCGPMLDDGNPVSWTPIGSISNKYTGTFDGAGHTISGLYIGTTANNQGLFGYVSGTVQNLSVSGSVKGDAYVGGVVGYNNGGTVTGCIFSGSGSVSVTGSYYVGGVVGENSGSSTVEDCYNTGAVSGSDHVGGVVGYNHSGGSVTNSYNTGAVSGPNSGTGNRVGGVVGYNNGGSVTGCYFLQGTAESGIGENDGSGDATATEKDDTAFHSGEVAWRLQNGQADGSSQVWGQSNLKDKNSWPTLIALDESAQPVYQVTVVYGDYADAPTTETSYTNNPAEPAAPSRDGYTFGGWDKTGEGTTTITYTAKWTPHTYSITASPSALDFGSITEGEERPAAQNVTITNSGNQTVTLKQPTANNFEITTSDSLTLAPNATASFTIQPKDKLPRGSYSEQIVVSNTNDEKVIITATFTIKEPPYTGKYSYELSTSVGDHGSLTVDRYATEGEKVTITVTPDEAYLLDDLVVTAGGKDVELVDNGDGTFSFTMPSADVRISATFAEDPDWTPDEPEEPTTDVSDLFIDIARDAWYKDAIQYAYDNGLMTGVSDTEFAPEATTTRAMIVSILARLENVTTAEAAGFADVNDEWYATAVNWAANVGVVNGYEDNTFRPNTAITREQLAAILMNYAACKGEDVSNRADLTSYTDQPSTWAEETMQWAVAEGLISGVTNTELQPQGNATRTQVAAILQRFLEA